MAYLSKIERAGFLSEDIKAFLATHDIEIPGEQALETKPDAPESVEKPPATKERNTFLVIIAALCECSGIDYRKSSKAAVSIQSAAVMAGASISETTIKNRLKEIPEALASRTK